MRWCRWLVWFSGAILAIGAEWAAWTSDAVLVAADLVPGMLLIGLGLTAGPRRPSRAAGTLLAASGFAWFAGGLAPGLLYLHRGVLLHLVVSYPSGRLRTGLDRIVVVAGYGYALAYPVARNSAATLAFGFTILLATLGRNWVDGRRAQRARPAALVAAVALALAFGLGAGARLAGMDADRAVLLCYDALIGVVAISVFLDLRWGRSAEGTLTGLVVDLGDVRDAGTLRDRLAWAVGDPSLVLGYWLPAEGRYSDETGRTVDVSAPGAGRSVTHVGGVGHATAVLVYDAGALGDSTLIGDIAAAVRLAVSNVRLQAEVRAQVAGVEASRRRIVEAADVQRRQLEAQLREGAERRLARVAQLIGDCGPPVAHLGTAIDRARAELREFARGIHPVVLVQDGLAAALGELGQRSAVPVAMSVSGPRLPSSIEVATYFICAEALANVTKHAEASQVLVNVSQANGRTVVRIADDGVGGADPAAGSGLRGLADRAHAVGGRFSVVSPTGGGTDIVVEFPVPELPR